MHMLSMVFSRAGLICLGSALTIGCGVAPGGAPNSTNLFNSSTTSPSKGTPISSFPAEVQSLLEKQTVWQTVVYQENNVGMQTMIQVMEQKKWRPSRDELTGALKMIEVTKLTLAPNASGNGVEYVSTEFRLDAPIDFQQFFFLAITDKLPGAFLRKIDENRFELISGSGKSHVVFYPASQESIPRFPTQGAPVGQFTAPLGPHAFVALAPAKEVSYLWHNLNNKIDVIMDVSFPDSHIPALDSALQKWNSAFGSTLFVRNIYKREVDFGDCYSSNKLCVRWVGHERLPWTGVGGSAQSTFDPETGLIKGGVVTFTNSVNGDALRPAPAEDAEKMRNSTGDLNWIASVYMRSDEFVGYFHPAPLMVSETILLHEIGHFNGLAHNFSGSLNGSVKTPSNSIMEYMPFSAVRYPALGDFDLALVNHVYWRKPLPENYTFCSDLDSVGGKSANTRLKKSNCNNFDVGEPVEWFVLLSRFGSDGVFSALPSGEKILVKLGVFLVPESGASNAQKTRVTEFLCSIRSEREKIASELSSNLGVALRCAN